MATPRFIKTISRNSALRNFTCLLGSLYIRFIHASGQWRVENQVIPEKLINEGKKIIIHHIDKDQHHAVGTPEDLKKYENSKNGRDV